MVHPVFTGFNYAVGPLKQMSTREPYNHLKERADFLCTLQVSFTFSKTKLKDIGILELPEEYVNPSFLVQIPDGGFRLVIAVSDVGRYSKPQPSRYRFYTPSNNSMEVHTNYRLDKIILSDSIIQRLYEILWCCNPI